MKLELVYINHHTDRFIYGNVYNTIHISFTETTIIDKDGVPAVFSNDILHLHFREKSKWREEQINKILNES